NPMPAPPGSAIPRSAIRRTFISAAGGDYRNPADIREFNVQRFRESRGFPAIFRTGAPRGLSGNISGGTDQVRYFFSATYNREEGPVDYNWQNKFAGRGNLGSQTTDGKFTAD